MPVAVELKENEIKEGRSQHVDSGTLWTVHAMDRSV